MKVFLDGQEILFREGTGEEIAARLQRGNLVIRSLEVNGVELLNASLEEALALDAPGKVVRITTAAAGDLLREAMREARDCYLPRLLAGLPEIRERFLEGDDRSVYTMINAVLEGLEWLDLTFRAYLRQGNFPGVEAVFTREYSLLAHKLQELETVLRGQLLGAACDLLEQEVAPFLEKLVPLAQELLGDAAGQ